MSKDLEPNSHLSHYRVVSKIGAGGMGEVYLAYDTKLARNVAIKFLSEELGRDPDKLKRFIQEARAASALNHPNILTVYEIGEADNRNYIATELIDGKTLREHLFTKQLMPLRTVLEIVIQVSDALAAAHQAGIIHRDIKPENIMIRKDGYAKVVDFGLAKVSEPPPALLEDISEAPTFAPIKTFPGMVMGTASYMSPEQARGIAIDARTDVFSLGVVLYELITGRQPFSGETPMDTMIAILRNEPPPLSETGLPIPPELEKITMCALEKPLDRRYQSIADMAEDLRALRNHLDFEAELERRAPLAQSIQTAVFHPTASETAALNNTIAVLPFLNLSPGKDGDYFSDGIAEELINVLSKIRGLRVAARTSAFSFKGKQTTIAEIGRSLHVASVLEGSIRTAGDRVRTAVQLVNVADGYQLWSATYDRTMDDIFVVQDDIAHSVVEELRSRLFGETSVEVTSSGIVSEVAAAVKGRAANPEAQRLMLLGRHFLDRTTQEDTSKAIHYFREALDLEPDYALCWAELGRAYSIEAGRVWVPVAEGFARSRDATNRALSFEPDLAEGHAQLGRIQIVFDWDFNGAEASFKRAVELAPGSSSVLDGAGLLEYRLGRYDEALELYRRVLLQDPLSAAFWHNLGLACYSAGLLEESQQGFKRALELVPTRAVSSALLSLVLMDQGRFDEAMAQAATEPYEMWQLWALAIIHNAAGNADEADNALQKLIADHAKGNGYQIAEVFAMRKETDAAFEWLEQAYAERDSGLTHAKANPRFRPLHDDPRWPALLTRIGFEV